MEEMEDMKRNGAYIAIARGTFTAKPDGNIELESGFANKIHTMSPEEFGKAFLMDRVLNQNVRNAMAKENNSRNSGMSR